MEMTKEAFEQLIRNRRSVFPKQFKQDEKVPDEVVKKILENALWAPNHGQTEPWHFVVFTGEGLKKLAAFQGELYKKVRTGDSYKQQVFEKFTTQPLTASHVIAICMKRDPNKKFPEIEEVEAVACAVQNMYLSTTVYGVGGYWTTGGVTYYEEAKPFFGLGEDDKLLGFFFLGMVEVPSPAAKRKPLEEKMKWIS